jgi:hypothetical protein
VLERAVWTHIVTAHAGLPPLRPGGLIAEITDGDSWSYRGNFFYDLAETGVMRLAQNWAADVQGDVRGITSVSLTPGSLRSEEMLARFRCDCSQLAGCGGPGPELCRVGDAAFRRVGAGPPGR